jgi:hypothetical protein
MRIAEFGMVNEKTRKTTDRDLKERTKKFALEIIEVVERLPRKRTADMLGR